MYDNIIILENEENNPEIGFQDIEISEKFVSMVYNYAKELQGNTNKYVAKYISEIVKLSLERKLLSLEDLYVKKEEEICNIFDKNFLSWKKFNKASTLVENNILPQNRFFISYETKKRNTIPLVHTNNGSKRIDLVSSYAKEKYENLKSHKDNKYAYIEEIERLD